MSAPKLTKAQERMLKWFADPATGRACEVTLSHNARRSTRLLADMFLVRRSRDAQGNVWIEITTAGRAALEASK